MTKKLVQHGRSRRREKYTDDWFSKTCCGQLAPSRCGPSRRVQGNLPRIAGVTYCKQNAKRLRNCGIREPVVDDADARWLRSQKSGRQDDRLFVYHRRFHRGASLQTSLPNELHLIRVGSSTTAEPRAVGGPDSFIGGLIRHIGALDSPVRGANCPDTTTSVGGQ